AIVNQGSQRPNPTQRAIVKYQAYNSNSLPAESKACVPNTGSRKSHRELYLKAKQESNDTTKAHPYKLKLAKPN
ncbi:hypothetical protein Bpfe_005308, partial [Biomphalaria pfeifferi]